MIDAAAARSPTHKPHVERGVSYLRDSFFRGEQWLDLEHVQREVLRWVLEVAGQRVHGTTQRRLLEVFEASERSTLLPLLQPRFDPTWYTDAKIHPDHCVVFENPLYTVPTRYVNPKANADVRGDSKLVRILRQGRAGQDPRAQGSWRALDRSRRLPPTQGWLHDARSRSDGSRGPRT